VCSWLLFEKNVTVSGEFRNVRVSVRMFVRALPRCSTLDFTVRYVTLYGSAVK
jgi:hypothetical protein